MDSVHTNPSIDPRTGALSAAGNDGLVDRLMQGAHAAVERVGTKAAPALEKLHSLEARAGQLAQVQGEVIDSARSYVRERPFTALAAAVLIGALAANLLRMR